VPQPGLYERLLVLPRECGPAKPSPADPVKPRVFANFQVYYDTNDLAFFFSYYNKQEVKIATGRPKARVS